MMKIPDTLPALYRLMMDIRDIRRQGVAAMNDSGDPPAELFQRFSRAAEMLDAIKMLNGKHYLLLPSSRPFSVDLNEEKRCIRNDLLFFNGGFYDLENALEQQLLNYRKQVTRLTQFLREHPCSLLIADRDGTLNVSCPRYYTSVQPAYNALIAGRYAKKFRQALLLSSAPLRNIGLLDLVTDMPGIWNYAASNGLQCLDSSMNIHTCPVYADWQDVFNRLDDALRTLLEIKEYSCFRFMGNGYQRWLLFISIAFRDKEYFSDSSIFRTFFGLIKNELKKADPSGKMIQYTTDERNMYIAPRIPRMINLNKAYGLAFLNEQLGLNISQNDPLVCGDSEHDLPMLRECVSRNPNTIAVFVTHNQKLQSAVSRICPASVFVSHPDILISAWYHLL